MSKALDMARELVKQLEEAEKKNKVRLSELKPGGTFKINKYDFIVLCQDDSSQTTKVISKGFMAENVVFDKNTKDYNKSNIKKMIEADIQPIIEKAVGAENLIEHTVSLISVDMQHKYEDCVCKVRPITFDEAREFNDLLVNKSLNDWGGHAPHGAPESVIVTTQLPLFLLLAISSTATTLAAAVFVHSVS